MRTETRLPQFPVYRFNGKRQPAAFRAGIEAFRALLVEAYDEKPGDKEFAERHAESIAANVAQGGAFALGYAAGLANWIAMGRNSTLSNPELWQPLYTPPAYREVNGGDYYDPPARSTLFDVDGAPVAVTEELAAYRFDRSYVHDIAVDDVRERGRPITRERFEALRGAQIVNDDSRSESEVSHG